MIDNPKSGAVKRTAALIRKKDRLARGRYIVEGPQAVGELLVHAARDTEIIYATTGTEVWQHEIDTLASEHGVQIERVTEAVLAAMSDTVHPQGVVAVARMQHPTLTEVFAGAKLIAVLHEVRDPGNAGAVLRAADAAGADAVVFTGDSIDPWHPKVVRATTGSLFHLPVAVAQHLDEVAQIARSSGLTVAAADVRGALLTDPEQQRRLETPLAWVFGNEARGLTDAERDLADAVIRLPIYGKAESLNLATAASVCLYPSAFAQRGAADAHTR